MTDEELDILAVNYLNGDLTEREFREALETHPRLKEIVALHQHVDEHLTAKEHSDYQRVLEAAIAPKKRGRLLMPIPVLAAAMVIVVFGVFFSVYYLMPRSINDGGLFTYYFEPYAPIGTSRGAFAADDNYVLGMALYEEARYGEAIMLLEAAEERPTRSLFLGICYLAEAQSNQALEILAPLTQENSLLKEPAHWYRALAYVRLGSRDQAIAELLNFQGSATQWARKAEELREDL